MEKETIYIVTGISTRFTGESEQCVVGAFRVAEKAFKIGEAWAKKMNEMHQEEGLNWHSTYKVKPETLY